MRICFKIGSIEHCYDIPLYEFPIRFHVGPPPPPNFPQLIHDATILASVEGAVSKISDKGVQAALRTGLASSLQALQKRAGAHVTIHASDPMPG